MMASQEIQYGVQYDRQNLDLLAMYDFYWMQIIIRQFILKLTNAEIMFSIRLCNFASIQI